MNVLDIFKSAILTDPDSVYIEQFQSGDIRCIFTEPTLIDICYKKFKGKVFWYNSGTETFETFWNDRYYCSSKHFSEFMEWIRKTVSTNNFYPSRFKSLLEESRFLSELDK